MFTMWSSTRASGALSALVIPGRPRALGLFGHEEDIIIPWSEIEVIGQETILVNTDSERYIAKPQKGFFG